jgi:NAD(P)-dependent dehydrogenase (short-subunit alcohol dehydrogenase family)
MAASLEGRTCIVTGATSGLGRACAEQLAGLGARVEIVCRNPHKGEQARSQIVAATGNPAVGVVIVDLESLSSVRAGAKELLDRCDGIDLLLNNAGITNRTRQTTSDGIEATFAVNHLAHFLLTLLLLERIRETPGARIVNVSSGAHKLGGEIDFDDIEFERTRFRWMRVYSRSKGANILFTRELARRLEGSGITAHSLHPGFVRSNLGADTPLGKLAVTLLSPLAMSAHKAAGYVVEVCTRPDVAEHNGAYYYKGRIEPEAAWVLDESNAKRLWSLSEELVDLKSPD